MSVRTTLLLGRCRDQDRLYDLTGRSQRGTVDMDVDMAVDTMTAVDMDMDMAARGKRGMLTAPA